MSGPMVVSGMCQVATTHIIVFDIIGKWWSYVHFRTTDREVALDAL